MAKSHVCMACFGHMTMGVHVRPRSTFDQSRGLYLRCSSEVGIRLHETQVAHMHHDAGNELQGAGTPEDMHRSLQCPILKIVSRN